MLFLHAWMLWLLPLASIPIILHLLTLQRLKTVELPTFRFLFDSYVQQRRKLQFLEALLAMLRTLFLLLFIFLVTRPLVSGWDSLFGRGGKGGGREVILLVDCSASMNAKIDGLSALERAKKAARQLAERLGTDDTVTLVRVASRPTEVFSRFNRDTKGILDKISEMELSSSRGNIFAALLQLFGPESAPRSSPAVYLFTDSQSDGWREARDQGLEKLLPEGLEFTVVHVGAKEGNTTDNLAVVGDAPRRNRAMIGLPFLLQPRVVNHSPRDATVTLTISVDGKPIPGGTRDLAIKAGGVATPVFTFRPTTAGVLKGEFRIKGGREDAFPDDDSFLFTLAVQPRVKVLVANGNPSPEALADEARYAITALRSRARDAGEDARRVLDSIDVVELPQARVTAEALRGASVVILCNCGSLDAGQVSALQNFVRDGGGLLVFPGDKITDVKAMNEGLFRVAGPRAEVLTDAELTPAVGDPDKAETFSRLVPNTSHPVMAVFNHGREDGDFLDVRVYRHFGLKRPRENPSSVPILYYDSRKEHPAMVESRMGDGMVILAGFPLHPRWGNLPLVNEFVPLLLRLVGHAEHHPDAEVSPVVVSEGPAELAVSASWELAEANIRLPDGKRVPVELRRQGARLLGSFEATAARGYYEVSAGGTRPDRPASATLGFAVNLAPQESDLRRLDKTGYEKILPRGVKVSFIDTTSQEQEVQGEIGSRKWEIWPVLIWLLFFLIGSEFLLATMGGRKREGDEGPTLTERLVSAGTGAWVGKMTGADGKDAG